MFSPKILCLDINTSSALELEHVLDTSSHIYKELVGYTQAEFTVFRAASGRDIRLGLEVDIINLIFF